MTGLGTGTAFLKSTVKLSTENGYDHHIDGLRRGDSVVLKYSGGTLLIFDWDSVTGRFSVNLAGNKFTVQTLGSTE